MPDAITVYALRLMGLLGFAGCAPEDHQDPTVAQRNWRCLQQQVKPKHISDKEPQPGPGAPASQLPPLVPASRVNTTPTPGAQKNGNQQMSDGRWATPALSVTGVWRSTSNKQPTSSRKRLGLMLHFALLRTCSRASGSPLTMHGFFPACHKSCCNPVRKLGLVLYTPLLHTPSSSASRTRGPRL
ncbi:hypothetical protein B0H67DRAFT_243883 [Lasiosphaeris hirsuta]|uniref:Secreted protein n=1 Tax=Lasiosphaeris hirsuta TaxID=260670 RepID=A0AA40AGU2_9PEZI|nr:hypothetical protein B0H67DRAFT_243883 [Lasiosphaeris hirsuta]